MPRPAKRPTLKDVAAKAGLSVMAASYTFARPERVSAASRNRILAAASELGYRPHKAAQALRTGSSGLIGVVVSEHLSYAFRDPGAAQFLMGVADTCVDAGKGMVLLPTGGQLDPAATVTTADVDGYIFWTTTTADPALTEAVKTGLPIAIQGGPAIEGVTCVSIDDREAERTVAAAALRGAHHPAVIAFPTHESRVAGVGPLAETTATLPVTAHRLDGIRDALREADLNAADVPCLVLTENNRSLAVDATSRLLDLHPHTDAIICLSDEIALGAFAILGQRRITVPARISLTGFDANAEAISRGITTISQDLRNQGHLAARIALGDTPPNTPAWSLVTGQTTR